MSRLGNRQGGAAVLLATVFALVVSTETLAATEQSKESKEPKQSEAQSKQSKAAAGATVIATLGTYQLTQEEVDGIWNRLDPAAREQYEKAGGKRQFLEEFVSKKLMVLEAERQGLMQNADVVTDLKIARDTILYNALLGREVIDKAFTEAQVKDYYEKNKDQWKTPFELRVRHILVTPKRESRLANNRNDDATTEEEAQAKVELLEERLAQKEPFETLAKAYSEDSTAPRGGDLGFFASGSMVKPFEEAALKLAVGEVSPVVKTEFGYHFIQGVERREAGWRPLAQVRDEIIQKLFEQDQNALYARLGQYGLELRKIFPVTVIEGKLK